MFRSGQANPYDDIVTKTTDENLTSENWELILNLCDKVQDEGDQGARSVIAAVLKRLAHRNPNVQLYALSLAEALSKNCTIDLHRELASRAFTGGLEKLITDRTTHEKVRRRSLELIALWTSEFENDPTLGIMEECYDNLKAKNYKFEAPQEPPPPTVDDEVRRKEEEELQRVLEMSVKDKGGRSQWDAYSAVSTSGAGGSGSSSSVGRNTTASASSAAPSSSRTQTKISQQPTYQSGYVAARTPSPKVKTPTAVISATTAAPATSVAPTSVSPPSPAPQSGVVTRVRAMHTFEPTEPGELAFEKGDVIKVVDRGYKDWWRGQLKGRTGIFPVNYVEPMPEPTAAELAKEAEQEAAVFAQAANVDKLLTMLRSLDPAKDNLADNEEIQELYRSSMALRPKIVKLIDKYNQKRADLVSMNDSFMRARTIFDQMMEESLARHTGMYESRPSYRQPPGSSYSGPGRPDSRARQEYGPPPGPQSYGWNPALYDQPGYNAFPATASAYPPGQDAPYQGPPQPYVDPKAYAAQQQQHQGQPQPQAAYPQSYGVQPTSGPYGPQTVGPGPYHSGPPHQQVQSTPSVDVTPGNQPQPQAQPHSQPQVQPQPQPQQVSTQAQPHAQSQQPAPQTQPGPPYTYDPNGTYADPNVQAWASYYAQGGNDPTGAVYFISVPGVTDGPSPSSRSGSQDSGQPAQQQPQPQAQPDPSPNKGSSDGYQPYPGATPPQQSTTSELAGYAGSQSQSQSELPPSHTSAPVQSTPAISSYGPSSPHTANQTPSTWIQASQHGQTGSNLNSPPSQYRQSVYQPQSTSPTSSTYPAQHQQPQAEQPQTQPPYSPTSGQYGDGPAPGYGSPGQAQGPQTHGSQGPAWHAQYAALQNQMQSQFAGMGIGADGTQSPHAGQQQQQQSLPGVGAPA